MGVNSGAFGESRWQQARRNFLFQVLLAVGLAGAATALRFAVDHSIPPGFPYVTYFPAVIAAAFIGGVRAGTICAVLGGLASWYWFIPPVRTFELSLPVLVALALYTLVVTVDVCLIHYLQVSARNLRAIEMRQQGLIGEQQALFLELQHRVANNLAVMASLLRLQKRRFPQQVPIAALDGAIRRVEIMALVHRQIYDPEGLRRGLPEFFEGLGRRIATTLGQDEQRLRFDIAPLSIDVGRLTTLSMLLAELLANALIHAFPEGKDGMVTIRIATNPDGAAQLTVQDNGVGLPQGGYTETGLGRLMSESYAQQLNGQLHYLNGEGTTASVSFPLQSGPEAD